MRVRQLLLFRTVEWQLREQVVDEDALDDLKMLVRVVRLTKRLLPGLLLHVVLPIDAVEHELVAAEDSALFLLRALLEEDLAQHILLLLVRVVVLHIVVMRLIEDRIAVVVAVRILVADASGLAECLVWIKRHGALLVLAGDQKYTFVEPADDWDFRRWSLVLRLWLLGA